MTTHDTATPALQQLSRTLSAPLSISITPSDDASAAKLEALKALGDDFLAITPALQAVARKAFASMAMAQFMVGESLDRAAIAAGEAIRAHLVGRFDGTVTDIKLRPKAHGRPGVATGALLHSIKTATITVTH